MGIDLLFEFYGKAEHGSHNQLLKSDDIHGSWNIV